MSHEIDFQQLTRAVEHDEKGSACKLMRGFADADIQDAIRALNVIQETNKNDRIEAIKNGQPDLPQISVSNEVKTDKNGKGHLVLGLSVPDRFSYTRDFNLKDGSSTGVGTGSILPSCEIRWWPEADKKN